MQHIKTMRDNETQHSCSVQQESALNKLSRDQLAGVGVSFKRSRNTVALNQFMDKLNKNNGIVLANQMTVRKAHL